MNWLYLTNAETGGSQKVPDEPGVRAHYEARGWELTVEPTEDRFIPAPGNENPDDNTEWVTLYHPAVNAYHDFPNNTAALAGAKEAGWEYPAQFDPETPPAGGNETPEPKPASKTSKSRSASATAETEKENG